MVRVFKGSTIPSVGFKFLWAIPVFARFDTRSNIAVPVVSEPVPAVVGTAMRGFSLPCMGRPRPRGALTKSRKSASNRYYQHGYFGDRGVSRTRKGSI